MSSGMAVSPNSQVMNNGFNNMGSGMAVSPNSQIMDDHTICTPEGCNIIPPGITYLPGIGSPAVTSPPPSASSPYAPLEPNSVSASPTLNNPQYLNSYLRTLVGKNVSVDFVIGGGMVVQKRGILASVGYNYITLYEPALAQYCICDFYDIKFVCAEA